MLLELRAPVSAQLALLPAGKTLAKEAGKVKEEAGHGRGRAIYSANPHSGRERAESMVASHLKETLDRYHVGDKLKHLRLRRKMGLVELSRHTGLSPALLSKLEHGP